MGSRRQGCSHHGWRDWHRPACGNALHRGCRLRLHLRSPRRALDAAVAASFNRIRAVRVGPDEADLDRLLRGGEGRARSPRHRLRQCRSGKRACARQDHRRAHRRNLRHELKGTIFTARRRCRYAPAGSIILTGSSAGTTGRRHQRLQREQGGLRNLARTWAEDLKGSGIVYVLSPGATATNSQRKRSAKRTEGLRCDRLRSSDWPIPRRSGPWLPFSPSSDSSFMTASEVAVDGGLAQFYLGAIPRLAHTQRRRSTKKTRRQDRSHHRRQQRDWLGHSQALRGRRCACRDHRPTREELKEAAAFIKTTYDGRERCVPFADDLDRLYAVVKENMVTSTFSSRTRAQGRSHRSRQRPRPISDQTFDVNVKGLFFTVEGPSL